MSMSNWGWKRGSAGVEMIREGFLKEVRVVLDKEVSWMIMDGGKG